MVNGLTSNYNDSGYSAPPTSPFFVDQNGSAIPLSTSFASEDIYISAQKIGVYMINGTYGSSNTVYPIPCSLTNLINFGAPDKSDDAWLVYPGYGFTLYSSTSYGGTDSYNYTNTSSTPVLFYFNSGGWNGKGTEIYQSGGTAFSANDTSSIKIYFRFQELQVTHLS